MLLLGLDATETGRLVLAGARRLVARAATEPDLPAAAVVRRVVTILDPFALGLVALGRWRLGVRREHREGADRPDRGRSVRG